MRIRNRGEIKASEIEKAYTETFRVSFRQRLFGQVYIGLADESYRKTNVSLIRQILKTDETDKQKYEAEEFDCDDFAFRLMGKFHEDRDTAAMPIFITWVVIPQGGHAVLSFYYYGMVLIIEPQTDKIFPVPEGWRLIALMG